MAIRLSRELRPILYDQKIGIADQCCCPSFCICDLSKLYGCRITFMGKAFTFGVESYFFSTYETWTNVGLRPGEFEYYRIQDIPAGATPDYRYAQIYCQLNGDMVNGGDKYRVRLLSYCEVYDGADTVGGNFSLWDGEFACREASTACQGYRSVGDTIAWGSPFDIVGGPINVDGVFYCDPQYADISIAEGCF